MQQRNLQKSKKVLHLRNNILRILIDEIEFL